MGLGADWPHIEFISFNLEIEIKYFQRTLKDWRQKIANEQEEGEKFYSPQRIFAEHLYIIYILYNLSTYTFGRSILGGTPAGGLKAGGRFVGRAVDGGLLFCPMVGLVLCGAKFPQSTPGWNWFVPIRNSIKIKKM